MDHITLHTYSEKNYDVQRTDENNKNTIFSLLSLSFLRVPKDEGIERFFFFKLIKKTLLRFIESYTLSIQTEFAMYKTGPVSLNFYFVDGRHYFSVVLAVLVCVQRLMLFFHFVPNRFTCECTPLRFLACSFSQKIYCP